MQRSDLLTVNGKIFVAQGRAINERADQGVYVLVVGNPANTNALIAKWNAPDVPMDRFSAMMRLDHNRAVGLLAQEANVSADQIKQMVIWGNHSDTQVPDISFTTIGDKKAIAVYLRVIMKKHLFRQSEIEANKLSKPENFPQLHQLRMLLLTICAIGCSEPMAIGSLWQCIVTESMALHRESFFPFHVL
jgi:hypothetical protein